MTTRISKYLGTPEGQLKPIPAEVIDCFRCPVCGSLLYRSENGWCCARSLAHTKLIRDYEMEEVIEPRLPPRKRASSVLRFVKARQRWCCRNGVPHE